MILIKFLLVVIALILTAIFIAGPSFAQVSEGSISEEGVSINLIEEAYKTGHSLAGISKSLANQAKIENENRWIPTDYVKGDIVNSSYTVQLGDTLWEIAEASYGDGYLWTKILQQNSNEIGFLYNGEQSLILPGQILKI